MSKAAAKAIHWAEQGYIPDAAIRAGIRLLIKERLNDICADNATAAASVAEAFVTGMYTAPVALVPDKANAQHYGCHVTTTTISPSQHAMARERIAAAGLSEQIDLLLTDYRDLGTRGGQYDKLVSIEMIEAVGHHYYDTYFRQCSELLKPEGAMLLQAITIADQQYEVAKNSVDFIQRYIFPGSCIPSVTAISDSLARVTDLRLTHLEDIGPHYATTLHLWHDNFNAQLDAVRALGYPETFIRMWQFYLCYCEAGFIERVIGDAQLLLIKPQCRLPPLTAPFPVTG